MSKIYRIKTKEEFVKEFGPLWRRLVKDSFTESMDHLFGDLISNEEYEDILRFGRCEHKRWYITKDMIKEDYECDWGAGMKKKEIAMYTSIESANKNLIKNVKFDEKRKTTTVILRNGNISTVKCGDDDVYDQKIGFCLAYTNAMIGSKTKVQKIVEEYNGVAKKKREEKELLDKLEKERALREYKKKQKRIEEEKRVEFEKRLAEYTEEYNRKNKKKFLTE